MATGSIERRVTDEMRMLMVQFLGLIVMYGISSFAGVLANSM